ncbi:MAG: hypothetical protein ACKO1T_11180 [Sediminibacterium sp.]
MKNLLLLSIAVFLVIACDTKSEKKEIKADPDNGYTVIKVVEELTMPIEFFVYPSTLNPPADQSTSLPIGEIRMVCSVGEIRMVCSVNYKVKISKKEILISNEADGILEKYTIAAMKKLDYGSAGGILKSYAEYDVINKAQQKIKIMQITGIDSSYSYIQFKENNKVRLFSLTKTQGPLVSMAPINIPIIKCSDVSNAVEKGAFSVRVSNK